MEPTTIVKTFTNTSDLPKYNYRWVQLTRPGDLERLLRENPHAGEVWHNTKFSYVYIRPAQARITDVAPCAEWQAKKLSVKVDPEIIRKCADFLADLRGTDLRNVTTPLTCTIGDWLLRLEYHEGQGPRAILILTAPSHPARGGWFDVALQFLPPGRRV